VASFCAYRACYPVEQRVPQMPTHGASPRHLGSVLPVVSPVRHSRRAGHSEMKKLRIVGDFGWEIARGAVSRRPPIPLYTYGASVWAVSELRYPSIQGPSYCRPVPNRPIRNLWVIVVRARTMRPVRHDSHGADGSLDRAERGVRPHELALAARGERSLRQRRVRVLT
jgi:hypothetical protein